MAASDGSLKPTTQDSESLNGISGKRKRVSSGEGKKAMAITPKKTRKSLNKKAKEKQTEDIAGKCGSGFILERTFIEVLIRIV